MRNYDGGSLYQGNPVLEISTLLVKHVLAVITLIFKQKKNIKKNKTSEKKKLIYQDS